MGLESIVSAGERIVRGRRHHAGVDEHISVQRRLAREQGSFHRAVFAVRGRLRNVAGRLETGHQQ